MVATSSNATDWTGDYISDTSTSTGQWVEDLVDAFELLRYEIRRLKGKDLPRARRQPRFRVVWNIEPRRLWTLVRFWPAVIRSRLSARSGYIPWRQRKKG